MNPEKTWKLKKPKSESIRLLQSELNCSEIIAQVLVNRGIETGEQARNFFDPSLSDLHDPRHLPDLTSAVERIRRAIRTDESIVIYSDRDVDGITGSAILLRTLQLVGVQATPYIPDKTAGYGLSEGAIERISNQDNDLLITVDCGTTAIQEIKLALDSGLDLIITDHHELSSDTLPEATVINPKRPASKYPNRELSGGAVAFKLARRLIEQNSYQHSESFLNMALPLACLSTLGDYMELNTENRALAKLGFDRIRETGLKGLSWLVDECGIESIRDLQWSLLPLLNAAQEDESGQR